MRDITYSNANEHSWFELLAATRDLRLAAPYSVHNPLNLSRSRHSVIADHALNAAVLQMPPGLNNDAAGGKVIRALTMRFLSFLPDTPPFVAEYTHAKLERLGGCLPQIRQSYFAYYIRYDIDYAMGANDQLCAKVTVTNTSVNRRRCSVSVKLSHPNEFQTYDYHYVSFHWYAKPIVLEDTSVTLKGDDFVDADGTVVARLRPGDFTPEWREEFSATDAEFTDNRFIWDSPYFPQPEFRVKHARNLLTMSAELEAGESRSFELTMDTSLAHGVPQAVPDFAAVSAWNAAHVAAEEQGVATVDFGDQTLNDRFKSLQLVTRQLWYTMDWPGHGTILFPSQGGTSERFFMWVWEVMCEMAPMAKLGYFQPMREILEFIFSLQDGGFPSEGQFTDLEGSLGTTGPKWACVTGAALTMAAQYFEASQDEEFARKYLDPMARAALWIVRQVTAPHPPDYPFPGLMPFCTASDGDVGRVLAITDNWSCLGIRLVAPILKRFGHPEAERIAAVGEQYYKDIEAAMVQLRQPDGFIPRSLNREGALCLGFEYCDSIMHLAYSGLMPMKHPLQQGYLAWAEKNAVNGFFLGPMSEKLMYIGFAEQVAALIYLATHQWKKAWCAIQTYENYGCTPDTYITQERYDLDDPNHTSWQPNASSNGRLLELELARLYFETPDEIILLGGFAPHELAKPHRRFAIHGLHTKYGKMDFEAQDGVASISWENPPELPICLPENWKLA